ncbi:MAG: sigma-70 family RNA polymerase sigma factor, partial [Roseivirga sp.]|nr:sigma-70 family RNA polymerase sigma factor [Roseivirga sp.]
MKENPEKDFIKQVTDAQGIVHKVCAVYCADAEQRKDLFQEILIQLWKSYPSFKNNAKFSTWINRPNKKGHIKKARR